MGINKIWLPFSADIGLIFILFICIGNIISKKNLLNIIVRDNTMFVLVLLIWILCLKFGPIELAVRSYPYGMICILGGVSGTIVVFRVSEIIDKRCRVFSNILLWYGRNSIYILGFHYIESMLIPYRNIFEFDNIKSIKILTIIIKIAFISILNIILQLCFNIKILYKKEEKNENTYNRC